jgi:molecular chaperone IbpA
MNQLRTIDADTLTKALIGFDTMFDQFERRFSNSTSNTYPPHNIIKIDDNNYEIQVAVTGFGKDEVTVELDQNVLIVTAGRDVADDEKTYLHRGLAQRNFVRNFPLAEHIEVKGAEQKNGILSIRLERLVPEALKPRRINITYSE